MWEWRGEERVRLVERVMWKHIHFPSPNIYTTICKIDSQWKSAYDTGNSDLGSVITQMGGMVWEVGGMFKTEGTYVYLWLIHADVWQKPIQYYKAIILQLKINTLKKISFQQFFPQHPVVCNNCPPKSTQIKLASLITVTAAFMRSDKKYSIEQKKCFS